MARREVRMSGSGGQGVIMGTIILAEAAFEDGKQVAQCQSYGPEARGGSSKAETIVSDTKIHYTKVKYPDLLLSLTQLSFDKYVKEIKDSTIIVVDSSIEVPDEIKNTHKVYILPILDGATEVIRNKMSANIISCGAINEIMDLADWEAVEKAVLSHVPKGTEESNLNALHYGAKMVREYGEN
ncbi:MAG: 2-oxoacid:acceptor oxidoreductase family protein [Firmicutes bacterium]|nr:2-oxoacid:acceptor oxidoreductase family protein [Bacillota bacterium]